MRILLDTHAVIWFVERDSPITTTVRNAIKSQENDIFVSSVSLWELAIKVSIGKLRLPKRIREIATELWNGGVEFIPITNEHAMATETLPWRHRDPFDRMLIAQAMVDGLTIATCDEVFQQYDVPRIW